VKIPNQLGLSSSVTVTNALDSTLFPAFVKSSAIFWAEKPLSKRREGDKGEGEIGAPAAGGYHDDLRRIAERLRMGSQTDASNLLHEKT